MRRQGRIALAALVLAAGAFAEESRTVTVSCPVCANRFQAQKWTRAHWLAGTDRDLCRHGDDRQFFLLDCWTCPRCLYSGHSAAFGPDPDAPTRAVIRALKKQNPLVAPVSIDRKAQHTGRVPAWVRFDLYLQVLRLRSDRAELDFYGVCMAAAQTQRFEWTLGLSQVEAWLAKRIPLPAPKRDTNISEYHVRRANLLETWAADKQTTATANMRNHANALAAVFYKRHGEDRDALRVVGLLEQRDDLGKELRALLKNLRARIDIEMKYRARALVHLQEMLVKRKPPPAQAAPAHYLVGVLQRQLGKRDEALRALKAARNNDALPENLRAWAADEIVKAKDDQAATK